MTLHNSYYTRLLPWPVDCVLLDALLLVLWALVVTLLIPVPCSSREEGEDDRVAPEVLTADKKIMEELRKQLMITTDCSL